MIWIISGIIQSFAMIWKLWWWHWLFINGDIAITNCKCLKRIFERISEDLKNIWRFVKEEKEYMKIRNRFREMKEFQIIDNTDVLKILTINLSTLTKIHAILIIKKWTIYMSINKANILDWNCKEIIKLRYLQSISYTVF